MEAVGIPPNRGRPRVHAPLKEIVAAAFNESGLKQSQDTVAHDVKIRLELEAVGLKFNAVDPTSFRARLKKSGCHAQWRTKMGDDAWNELEKQSGPLT